MKDGAVSLRKTTCRIVLALGCFAFVQLLGVRRARAESPRKVEGFEILGTLGYGVAVGDLTWDDEEIAPYGVMVGLELGYTLPFGLRIGADAIYGFGRSLEERRPMGGVVVETDVSSAGFGGSLGYDLLVPLFRLRGAVDAGLLTYHGAGVFRGASWYIGPEVALIWQYRALELGLQSKYWLTSADGPGNNAVVQVGIVGGARF